MSYRLCHNGCPLRRLPSRKDFRTQKTRHIETRDHKTISWRLRGFGVTSLYSRHSLAGGL